MKRRKERQFGTRGRAPRATSLVVSVLFHGIAIFGVISGAWLWGTPNLDKLASYTVSLIDAPLSLRKPSSDTLRPAPASPPPLAPLAPLQPEPAPEAPAPKPVPVPPKTPKVAVAEPAAAPKEAPKVAPPPTPKIAPVAKKAPAVVKPKPKKATTSAKAPKPPAAKKAPAVVKPRLNKAATPAKAPKSPAAKKPRSAPPKQVAKKPTAAMSKEAQTAIRKLRKRQAQREVAGRPDEAAQHQAHVAAARVAALRQQVAQNATTGAAAGLSRVRLAAYQERVRAKIIEAWILPLPPQQTHTLQATALFRVMRDGHVEQLALLQPSGNALFDASLIRAIKRSSPLPNLPLDYSGNSLEVEMRFSARES